MSAIAKWTAALLICGACVTVSYFFVDRPFAYFVHDELRGYRAIFDLFGRLPKVLGLVVIGCTLIFGVRAVMGRPLTEIQTSIVLSALSLALRALCPLLAHSGHALVHRTCPLSGGKADMTFCVANSA